MHTLKFLVLLCLVFKLVLPSEAHAQIDNNTSPFVYRVQSSSCPSREKESNEANSNETGSTVRIVTGFRVKGSRGIVTALHGVVGCKVLMAQLIRGGDYQTIDYRNLEIGRVDIAKDLAVLWSEELSKLPLDGLEPSPSPNLSTTESFSVLGHPDGINEQEPTVDIKYVQLTRLGSRLKPVLRSKLLARKSPSINTIVLQLQGPLVPGLSGAPLLNKGGKLVGIVNGGLEKGQTDRAWAIPWLTPAIEWKSVNTKAEPNVSNEALELLRDVEAADLKVDPSVLFNIPGEETPTSNPTVTPASKGGVGEANDDFVVMVDDVEYKLVETRQTGGTLSFTFLVTNKGGPITTWIYYGTTMTDTHGDSFEFSRIRVGSRTTGKIAHQYKLPSEVPTRVTIEFSGIAPNTKTVPFLQIVVLEQDVRSIENEFPLRNISIPYKRS